MKKYEKMTTLPLAELAAIVHSGMNGVNCEGPNTPLCGCGCSRSSAIPVGQAANEIGIIFVEEGDKRAEEILTGLIANNSFMAPGAYFYLSQKRDIVSPETKSLLKQFEENPANNEKMELIKKKLAELAEETA